MNRDFRITFIDHETLLQGRTLYYKRWYGVAFLTGGTLLTAVLTSLLIAFVPGIRKHIPGYTNPDVEERQTELLDKILLLESKLAQQDSFVVSLKRLSDGGDQIIDPQGNDGEETLGPTPEPQNGSNDLVGNPDSPVPPSPFKGFSEYAGTLSLFKPVNGLITKRFKAEERHFGVDLVAGEDATIHSVAGGFVIFSEYSNANGYMVCIAHGDNLFSIYKHNSRVFKKTGSYVTPGEAIAVIGNSGENTSGPHLHFELWWHGKPVDPELFMNLKK